MVMKGRPGDPRVTEYLRLDRRMDELIEEFGLTKANDYLEFAHHIRGLMAKLEELHADWLWIDALCIDQSDARERTHQVGMMSKIFGRANKVISWLGPAYDNSEYAMATIAGYKSETNSNVVHALSQAELSEAICSLCERSYWKWLWVFQELRHAKHIILMCGDGTIDWNDFRQLWCDVVNATTTNQHISERLTRTPTTRMMALRKKPITPSLWNLLEETRDLECLDQRDRVFALLSVAIEGHEGIEPDYDSSVTPLDLAHRILQNKYALRSPGTLSEVLADCKNLESAFRMKKGSMLIYRGHDAGGNYHPYLRNQWCGCIFEWMQSARDLTEFLQRCLVGYARHGGPSHCLEGSSYIDIEGSGAAASWSTWAEFHGHTTVTCLLQKGK